MSARLRKQPGGRRRGRLLGAIAIVLLLAAVAVWALDRSAGPSSARHSPRRAAGAAAAQQRRDAAVRDGHASVNRSVRHVLSYTSYIRAGSHRRREVALTFDDGPGPYTARVLAILRRAHVRATFFVVGREVKLYPQLIRAEHRLGEAIGDHTLTHPMLSSLSEGAQHNEIGGAKEQIAQAGAPRPRLFRPPYGAFNATTLRILGSERMLMVLWSVDTKDYEQPGPGKIAYVAISGATPGAIILMHDGGGPRGQDLKALPRIIRALRRRHLRLVTVPQLLADDPPPHQPPPRPLSGIG